MSRWLYVLGFLVYFCCHSVHAAEPHPQKFAEINLHKAGFGGSFRLATAVNPLSSGNSSSLAPASSLDFRTWSDKKIFGFGVHFGMNLIVAGSQSLVGIVPGISFDFGLLRQGPLLPYLGVKLQLVYVYANSGGLIIEIQPHFGLEMFLFLQRKMSLYLEVGIPISIPVRGGGVAIELGGLSFGFRYYV